MREASQQGFKVAVRSGGHSWIASSVRSGGLLFDMSAFNSISIDATTRTAKVGSAVRSAQLVKALWRPRDLPFQSVIAALRELEAFSWEAASV